MASTAVISAVKQVGSLSVEEAKFLYNVKDKIDSLQIELEWMECFLEDADSRQYKEKLVRKWIAQIIDFAYEAEDILERYLHQVPHRQGSGIWNTSKWFSKILCACHVYKLHCLGSDIDDLTVKIAELNCRLKRYGVKLIGPAQNMAYNAMIREERRTYAHVQDEAVGLDIHVQQVVDRLTKTRVKVVGVSGMGGLGKSTLARKVFVDKAIKRCFGNRVWVYIAKEFSKRNVFEEILGGLDEGDRNKIKELSDGELPQKIHEHLQKKACFLVLDDIWTNEAWDTLAPALGSIITEGPSKILLTTRDHGLQQHADSNGYSHPLNPLNEENSWKLFLQKAFPRTKRAASTPSSADNKLDEEDESQVDVADHEKTKMKELGREMLKDCHGLPLAIVALGGILSVKRTSAEWEEVKNNVSAYLMTGMGDGGKNGGILPVLELSYNALPFYLKPCFLYLASFPEDYEILAKRLYRLWEAEGILEIPNRDETGVGYVPSYIEMGESYLLELIQRSMVQVGQQYPLSGRIKTCRVHDLMRDLCIKKCKEASFLSVQAEVITTRKQLRRCALHVEGGGIGEACFLRHGEEATCIRSLSAFQLKESKLSCFRRKDMLNMVKCFPLLRVLDLEDAKIQIKVLEVGYLIHLRYLSLRYANVDKVASCIGDLKYLMTLDLRDAEGSMLPNKFQEMKRLRHLYLPLRYSVKGKKKLSFGDLQMETLKNFCPMKCETEDLLKMTSLRFFSMNDCNGMISEDDLEVLAKTPLVKSEQLVSSVGLHMEMKVIDRKPTILTSLSKGNKCFVKLSLRGEEGVAYQNMENAIAREIPVFPCNLTRLYIKSCELGRGVILQLEKLPILQLLHLSGVYLGDCLTFSASSFPSLVFLYLELLPELEEWEVGDGAIPRLQHLEIYQCRELRLPENLPDSLHMECR